MATIKSYTDIEQSKKLAKILSIESADMYYWCGEELRIGGYKTMNIDYDIPCWSLAALLGFIPNYKLSSEHNYHTCTAETSFGEETVGWFDSPVDACYEMILKLKKLKLLFAK